MPRGAKGLDEIQEQYRASDQAVTGWPAGAAVGAPFMPQQPVTGREAELLDQLGLPAGGQLWMLINYSAAAAAALYPDDSQSQGAYRSALWSALVTEVYGVEFADEYGQARAGGPEDSANQGSADLYNGEVGRLIALQNPDASPLELSSLIKQAARGGQLVVLDEDGQLQHSERPGQ